jgi:membrane-anchored glycerophosphoryl diester phosphodiesterase (GDPDase)
MSRLYLLAIFTTLVYYYPMIGKDSTKLIFTLPKTLYSQLKQEAKEQNRSMANLIVVILTDYFKKKGDSSYT